MLGKEIDKGVKLGLIPFYSSALVMVMIVIRWHVLVSQIDHRTDDSNEKDLTTSRVCRCA
jgi:hypothetical protein